MSKCHSVLGFETMENRVVLSGNIGGSMFHLSCSDDFYNYEPETVQDVDDYTVEIQEQKIGLLLPAIQKVRD